METSGRRRTTIARVVVAVSSLLIVLGAARIGLEHALDRRGGATPAVAGGATTPAGGKAAPTSADTTGASTGPEGAVEACVRKQVAATAVIVAARQAELDWRQYLQGQTALRAGEMTLSEVNDQVWGPTRRAGPTDVAVYVRATDSYATLPACQAPSGSAPPALAVCLTRQSAIDAVLTAAALVVGDWHEHLDAMARHAAGGVSGAQAQEDWLRRWTASGSHLRGMAAAESTLAVAPDCQA